MVESSKKSQSFISSAAMISITPAPIETTKTMDSPEGSKMLTLESRENIGVISYSIFVSSRSDGKRQLISEKENVSSPTLSIPFNTWSPNTNYFFLKEENPTVNNYYVYQSSGELFSNNLPYLSIQELFSKSFPNYVIEDVTGWADQGLLIVNTKSVQEDQKLSFWFDLPSQSFIQLGTYFK